MQKKRRGLEVQFMDSIDTDISSEELHKQLDDAFRADHASAQDFIDSVFKPSESTRYDIDLRELSHNTCRSIGNPSYFKDRRTVPDLRPGRHAKKSTPYQSALWLKKVWQAIFGKRNSRNEAFDRWQDVARK
jgi:hypothetical protein